MEEIDRYLEKVSLPRLNQGEIGIMNNSITNTEIEIVIKNLPKKQNPRARWLHRGNSIKHLVKSLFFWNSSKKIAEEGTLPNSFYKVTITLIPHPDTKTRKRQHTKKENYMLISLINIDAKTLNKILPESNKRTETNSTFTSSYTVIKLGLFQGIQGFFNIHRSINMIHHINKLKDKNHMVTQ